ncbi:hypothetical protein [Bacteroides gallinarum]|uniref:hypothetical protein n=1 Tax=Bacteroides gallinarum TaxID=376806 RepID=UPI00036EB0EE|nr:hypothetical protein [Bacteroides gallinarum]
MRRFTTETFFVPLKISEELGMTSVKGKDGKEKKFRTRKAVEKYCKENKCIYVEHKFIFYR